MVRTVRFTFINVIYDYFVLGNFLGASACVKLTLLEKAITWCDEGLAVSFEFDCIFMVECKGITQKNY